MDDLTKKVKLLAKDKHADLVGITSIDRLQQAPHGHKPQDLLPRARSVIVMGMRTLTPIIHRTPIQIAWEHLINLRRRLDNVAYDIATLLEDEGYRAFPVSNDFWVKPEGFMGPISHKHAAVAAGLGEIGKSSLLITPKYGPNVQLVSIITDAPLNEDTPFTAKNFCEHCDKCVKACPANAILNYRIDKSKCYEWPNENLEPMWSHDYAVCIDCMKACPIGKEETV